MTNQRIIYTNASGGVSVIVPTGDINACIKDVPAGVEYEIITTNELPQDRYFRNAWVKGAGVAVEDLDKCKEIGHEKRRTKRAEEFAPHDEVIMKQIPGQDAVEAEAARTAIRTKYETMQTAIDAAATPSEIKALLEAG
jgi:hypothetical protein